MSRDQGLYQEIATASRDLTQPVYGGILRPQDDTLMTRGQGRGLKIYDEIERDCHAYAVLQKRKMAVVARERVLVPASDRLKDRKAAELVERQLADLPFDRICLDLLDALLKGYAVGEILWALAGDGIGIASILPREQRRFAFDLEGQPRLLVAESPVEGIELPSRKFLVHRFGAKDSNPYGLGLGTRLFWPVWFKRQGITFWLTFADKFGNPTAVGKYPEGTSAADQRKLLAAIDALASDTGVVIPEGMMVELLEAQRAGTINTHEALARYMDEQVSEAVLGETLSTNIGQSGSRAASQTHNEVREELTKADADLLSDTLNNTLLRWIVEFNLPGALPPKLWRSFEEPEDMTARSQRDKSIHDMGYDPTPAYIEETYGPGWNPRAPGAAPALPASGDAGGAFAEGAGPRDDIDHLAEQLDHLAGPAMDALIGRIRDLVESCQSLAEVADRLVAAYPDLDAKDLALVMGQALATAELTGRAEIADGAPA